MKTNKILRNTVIFFVLITIINVTAAITILSRTSCSFQPKPEMRNRLFDVESLKTDLDLSSEQSEKIGTILDTYRSRAEFIHTQLKLNHRKSQRAIILNNPDSSVFKDAINEYGDLHKQMKKESVLFIQKINNELNEDQKALFRGVIKERTNCKMTKKETNKRNRNRTRR